MLQNSLQVLLKRQLSCITISEVKRLQRAWILRHGELGLKSRVVRRQFQRALDRNLETLAIENQIPIIRDRIKTMEVVTSSAEPSEAEDLLCHILGIVALDPAEVISDTLDPEVVAAAILERDASAGVDRTFGVRARRLGAKGKWSSQEYCSDIGAAMWRQDGHLSVDLTNPDMWVRLVMEPDRVWLMGERITGAGGLPPGVQGDVLCRITDDDSLISAFLIMRRGSRLIPVDGCDEGKIAILKRWDPFLGRRSKERTPTGGKRKRHPWGVVGLSVEEGEGLIHRRESDVKTVPLSSLEPLCGWTGAEKSSLMLHILEPANNPPTPDIKAWVS